MVESAIAKALVNWLHLSAAMVWLGAIFTTPLVMTQALESERESVRLRVKARYHSALSPIAWSALGLLTVTGIIRAIGHLENGWSDLIVTDWGRLLLMKLAIIGVMVSAGAYARYRLIPRLQTSGAHLRVVHGVTAILGFVLLWVITLL